jgi:hypothetical protein
MSEPTPRFSHPSINPLVDEKMMFDAGRIDLASRMYV